MPDAVAENGSVKAFRQVSVDRRKKESPAPDLMIKAGKGERSCLLDGGKDCVHGGQNSQREVSLTQYDQDPVEHTIKEKENIPGEWKSPSRAITT